MLKEKVDINRILVPVLTAKTLPRESGIYLTSMGELHFRVKTKTWHHNSLQTIPEVWLKSVAISDLIPDKDWSYDVANAAAQGSIVKILMHQEGQSFFKNNMLKVIKG